MPTNHSQRKYSVSPTTYVSPYINYPTNEPTTRSPTLSPTPYVQCRRYFGEAMEQTTFEEERVALDGLRLHQVLHSEHQRALGGPAGPEDGPPLQRIRRRPLGGHAGQFLHLPAADLCRAQEHVRHRALHLQAHRGAQGEHFVGLHPAAPLQPHLEELPGVHHVLLPAVHRGRPRRRVLLEEPGIRRARARVQPAEELRELHLQHPHGPRENPWGPSSTATGTRSGRRSAAAS